MLERRKSDRAIFHALRTIMPDGIEAIKQYLENDHFAAACGMRLVELRPGFAKTCLKIDERHLNSAGLVQGGAIFTLAAFAFEGVISSIGQIGVGINTNISFLKATQSGTLHAEATEISRSKRLSVCTVRVTNDSGELVAMFQGTAYIKAKPFPSDA
jgi:acyl-CoA thioesterase